jgi:hypothetical protein
MTVAAEVVGAVPPDAVETAVADVTRVERVGSCWYARDVFALLEDPRGLSADIVSILGAWVRCNDANVRLRRPFGVDDGRFTFDWHYRREFAPRWWVEAARAWSLAHGYDERGRRAHYR